MRTHILIAAFAPACLAIAGPAAAATAQAKQFLTDAMKGNNSEMVLGKIAAERGASEAMRDFGTTLQQDHGKAQQNAMQAAHAANIAVATGMKPEARQEEEKLKGLHGDAFDHEFARYMVDDHKKDIAKYEQAVHLGGPVGSYAQQTLPDLHKHLAIAEKLNGGT